MNANELRIGNFVNLKDSICKDIYYCKIVSINIYGYIDIDRIFNDGTKDWQPVLLKDIKPILLTEEWLLKFGAIKNNDWYDIGIFGLNFVENRMVSKTNGYYNQYKLPKYVHQFQNLIFVLSGEELQLKS